MSKIIIMGDIVVEEFSKTPLDNFKKAIRLSQSDDNFLVYTNNVMVVETLEVLCGEENINIYLKKGNKNVEIEPATAYNFVGDIYRIINSLRFQKELNEDIGLCFKLKSVDEDIKEYIKKYDKILNDNYDG